MSNSQLGKFTHEQALLVQELVEDHGIEASQVIFFTNDPKPIFEVEAAAALARKLAGATGIGVTPAVSQKPDTITVECGITFAGFSVNAFGSANVDERIDGSPTAMSPQQLERLASSRAMRSALVMAGIDLVKLHRQRRSGNVAEFTGPEKSNRDRLLAQAHILGSETGLIDGNDKSLWYQQLYRRYQVKSSAELGDAQLSDWIAFLSSLKAPAKLAA